MFNSKTAILVLLMVGVAMSIVASCPSEGCEGDETATSTSASVTFRGGPGPVCQPDCGYYATTDQYQKFMNARCCCFIQCPNSGPAYSQPAYNAYKAEYCQNINCNSS